MPEKVVIYLPGAPEPVAAAFNTAGGYTTVIVEDAAAALDELRDATGLIVGGFTYRSLFPEFMHRPTALQWIQSAGSGFDMFEKLGVPPSVRFMRAVGVWGQSVAGHAVALTLALMRNLPQLLEAQRTHHWTRDEMIPGIRSVAGRRIVVLGYGDIGQIIAAALRALDADVSVVASRARTGPDGEDIRGLKDLDGLLADAEGLVMSLPLTPDTRHLINADRIARMRGDAVLVNVGRGETIDTAALAEALSQGRIGGAGLDVFEQEPLAADSVLWRLPNVILTPHVANFGDRRSGEKLGALALENARKLARGEEPLGLVPVPAFGPVQVDPAMPRQRNRGSGFDTVSTSRKFRITKKYP